ncbi:MAG: N-acetylmuramoyl-L-alanine amidase [Peptococcaceae bacterium]|nr:N-acetylmuramoyl-L-alanine amidase [Peptococcaceae bacterium]
MRKSLILFLLYLLSIHTAPVAASPVSPLKGKIVVVDPGHGGYDPGAVRGEVYEKHINLQIALKLKKTLEEKGAVVILTRDGDYNLAIVGLHKNEAHRYDLSKRLEIANNSKASLFISIHVNCICQSNHGGAEVFYYPESETGKLLAECIQAELRTIPGIQKRIAKTSDCYVLRNARIPAALVEVGYLSNPDERKKILQSEYQTILAEKISRGILKYMSSVTSVKYPGDGYGGTFHHLSHIMYKN